MEYDTSAGSNYREVYLTENDAINGSTPFGTVIDYNETITPVIGLAKPSNFTLIETSEEEAEKISNHLMNDGIIIRRLNSYNLPNFLRISIGTKEEMIATIKSLKKIENFFNFSDLFKLSQK